MFNNEQLEKLADLAMDIAKAQLIVAIGIPAVNKTFDLVFFIQSMVYGIFFVFVSLKIIRLKKVI